MQKRTAKSNDSVSLDRRGLLQVGVMGLTGMALPDYLRAAAEQDRNQGKPKAQSILFINLAGGPSHLDSLDVKPEGPSETRGEFKTIPSKITGLPVCELLPRIAQSIDQYTLIRGISHTAGAHPQGQSYISTGNRPSPAVMYPSYGSIVSKEFKSSPDLPPYVAIPQTEWNAGYMGDAYAAFKTNAVPRAGSPFSVRGVTLPSGLTIDKVDRRQKLLQDLDSRFAELDAQSDLLEALDTFGKQAHQMITSKRTQKAFDVSLESKNIQSLFENNDIGQSLLLATRLIEYGSRFVTVTNQGWDTHLDNFRGHRRLLPPFDAAFTATVKALKQKGLLDKTLVVAMGEFGRTPKINPNVGRDHYPRVNWCLMAGGGVRNGQLIGGTDKGGTAPDEATDIHPDDIGASMLHALGIDHRKEYHTKTGRPVMLIPNGNIIDGLFG